MQALTRSLIYLACTTIYDFFLFHVGRGGIYLLCHPRNLRVVLAALIPQNVISEQAGVSVWHVPFSKAGWSCFTYKIANSPLVIITNTKHVDQSSPSRTGSSETHFDRDRCPRPRRQVKQHRFLFYLEYCANPRPVAQDGKRIDTPSRSESRLNNARATTAVWPVRFWISTAGDLTTFGP
jgi:hypothetical protein